MPNPEIKATVQFSKDQMLRWAWEFLLFSLESLHREERLSQQEQKILRLSQTVKAKVNC